MWIKMYELENESVVDGNDYPARIPFWQLKVTFQSDDACNFVGQRFGGVAIGYFAGDGEVTGPWNRIFEHDGYR